MEKSKIQELYDDAKSRKFVNHLIQSYLPLNKTNKVWQFEDKKSVHKCSCCKHALIDVTSVMDGMRNPEFMKATTANLIAHLDDNTVLKQEDHPMYKYVTHGAILAWKGEKTDTHLCGDCLKDLLELAQNGILMGDKNISYIIHKMQRAQMFNYFKESPKLNNEEKEEVKKIEKRIEVNKKHTATFGDIEALQKLKEKMESESKDK